MQGAPKMGMIVAGSVMPSKKIEKHNRSQAFPFFSAAHGFRRSWRLQLAKDLNIRSTAESFNHR
jgi:hypothetical protein